MNYELHAQQFLSGRGAAGSLKTISRHKRAQIFHTSFKMLNYLNQEHGVTIFNVCNADDNQYRAFERLLNRVDRTMLARKSFAHLICDQGKEDQYTALVRKMRVHNHIRHRTLHGNAKVAAQRAGRGNQRSRVLIEALKASLPTYFPQNSA